VTARTQAYGARTLQRTERLLDSPRANPGEVLVLQGGRDPVAWAAGQQISCHQLHGHEIPGVGQRGGRSVIRPAHRGTPVSGGRGSARRVAVPDCATAQLSA
jgi:hypothetical protein